MEKAVISLGAQREAWVVEPGRSRWQRRVWAGFKNAPLLFQVRQVKEPCYLWEASPLQLDLAGEAVVSWLAFVGVW